MSLTAPYKLIAMVVIVIAVTVLMSLHDLTTDAGMPVLSLFVGFIIGNGNSALGGNVPPPVIGPSPKSIQSSMDRAGVIAVLADKASDNAPGN
jgi:hypothetical protein